MKSSAAELPFEIRKIGKNRCDFHSSGAGMKWEGVLVKRFCIGLFHKYRIVTCSGPREGSQGGLNILAWFLQSCYFRKGEMEVVAVCF